MGWQGCLDQGLAAKDAEIEESSYPGDAVQADEGVHQKI